MAKYIHILLSYRQAIFIAVYSHLLRAYSSLPFDHAHGRSRTLPVLDHSSQVWWRWINIFFTLVIWAVELLVSGQNDAIVKEWKVD